MKNCFLLLIIFLVMFGAVGCAGAGDSAADGSQGNAGCGGPTGASQSGAGEADGAASADDAGHGGAGESGSDGADGASSAGSATQGGEGSNAPDVPLQDLDGNTVALTDFAGEVVVLNFWASWCPPCRMEMPDLNELDQELKRSGEAVLITVNLTDGQRETKETARQYIEENGFGFTVLFDEQGLLAREYMVSSIPQTFILDRAGDVSGSIIGATTKEAILGKVSAVL